MIDSAPSPNPDRNPEAMSETDHHRLVVGMQLIESVFNAYELNSLEVEMNDDVPTYYLYRGHPDELSAESDDE